MFSFQLGDGDFCLIPHEHSQPIKQSEHNKYIDRIFTEQQENYPPTESSKSSTTSEGIIIVFIRFSCYSSRNLSAINLQVLSLIKKILNYFTQLTFSVKGSQIA